MPARSLASLGLPQELQDKLSAANYVYVDDLRGVRPLELARDLKVPNEEALRVLQAASGTAAKSVLAGASTALELTQHPRKRISTGSGAIDGILGGGVALGEVIEVRPLPHTPRRRRRRLCALGGRSRTAISST